MMMLPSLASARSMRTPSFSDTVLTLMSGQTTDFRCAAFLPAARPEIMASVR
jgi:hypothetical protein